MQEPRIVTRDKWLEERKALLEKEKEFTRLRDALSMARRSLPWVPVDKEYVFDTKQGEKSLSDLFDGRSQLIIYHFMYGPSWGEQGCKSCSFWADNYNDVIVHLRARDVTMLAVSRNDLERISAFQQRMGWTFAWVSSLRSDFNYDYQATTRGGQDSQYNYRAISTDEDKEMPGISVFYKDQNGQIFHTYSCYARELETFNTAYRYLDIVPKGRDEDELPYGMAWVRHHDRY